MSEPNPEERRTPEKCPECGSTAALPIFYGTPNSETGIAAEAGELVLGGCTIAPDAPIWHCGACDYEWGELRIGDSGVIETSPTDRTVRACPPNTP